MHHLDCIVPEVSRSIHQNVSGVHLSHKEWQRKFGNLMFYYDESVDSFRNLQYLEHEIYNAKIQSLVSLATTIHPLSRRVPKQFGEYVKIIIPHMSPIGNRYWRHWFRLLQIPLLQEIQGFYKGTVIFPIGSQTVALVYTDSPFHRQNDTFQSLRK